MSVNKLIMICVAVTMVGRSFDHSSMAGLCHSNLQPVLILTVLTRTLPIQALIKHNLISSLLYTSLHVWTCAFLQLKLSRTYRNAFYGIIALKQAENEKHLNFDYNEYHYTIDQRNKIRCI